MTPETILEKAEKAGVTISISRAGRIKASGDQKRVNQLIPIIRGNKKDLLKFLQRPSVEPDCKKPYITNNELRIPSDCNPRFRYWQKGQSVFDTLVELGASDDLIENYINPISNPDAWRRWREIKNGKGQQDDKH